MKLFMRLPGKKEIEIVLKLNYEKAYDRVNWEFLVEVLTSKCFSKTWINWIINLTRGGSVCVRLNDVNGPYFTVGKGLRQGDPLPPLLFNLVVDVFTKMLTKACTQGLISGLLTNVVEGGIVSLQMTQLSFLKMTKTKPTTLNGCWLALKISRA